MEDLQFTFSVGYVDTEIKDPNLQVAGCGAPCTLLDPPGTIPPNVFIDGNPLPQAPKWTASFIVDWRHQLERGQVYAIADWVYRDEINYVLYEAAEYTGDALGELGLRIGYNWADGQQDISVFGRNITDEEQNIYTIDFNNLTGVINDPATWGIEYQYRY
jgi:iron complex outermembrane receptor protein